MASTPLPTPSLSTKVASLTEQLVQTVREIEHGGLFPARASLGGPDDGRELVKEITRLRSLRSAFFPPGLFGEPAWDILLDMYIAEVSGQRLSVSDACIGSNAPMTTALRTLQQLEGEGLIERSRDTNDKRRCYVRLSRKAIEAMEAFLRSSAARR